MRIAIYARVSRDRDGKSTSVEQQVTECRQYAVTKLHAEPDHVFTDNDISAYTGKRRPAWEQLLAAATAGTIDAVIVWEQSRLTRTPAELEAYMHVCEPRSIPTYTVNAGTLDLTTDQGRMIARIVGATNRYEVDQLRGRVKRGMRARAGAGKPVGGRRPFGFQPDRVTHLDDEAALIRDASHSLLRGDTIHGIARQWRATGSTTTTGKPWTTRTVREVLQRPRNAALAEHRGNILGNANWEPIVTIETWQQVCALLADPARRTTPGTQPAYLGTFIYRCGVCGELMRSWRSGAKGTRIYRCSTVERNGVRHPTIPIEPTDQHVADYLIAGMHEQGFSIATPATDTSTTVDRAEKITALEARRRTVVRNHAAGLLSDEDLDDALQVIAAQLSELDTATPVTDNRSDVTDLLDEKQAWDALPLDRRRAIVADYADVQLHLADYRGQPVGERITITLQLE